MLFDTNYWKSFVQARWKVALGDRGCLSLFGDRPEACGVAIIPARLNRPRG